MSVIISKNPATYPHIPKSAVTISNNILMPISVCDLSEFERRIHQDVTMKFICDRGVSHEMVRHRVASFAQESTRYCNYSLDKFGKEITVVRPSWCGQDSDLYKRWFEGCRVAEDAYFTLLDEGATPRKLVLFCLTVLRPRLS